jgi:hypothetical protein
MLFCGRPRQERYSIVLNTYAAANGLKIDYGKETGH